MKLPADTAAALQSDLAAIEPAERASVVSDVLRLVWDALDDYASDALRALAEGVTRFTASRGPVVGMLGTLAAGLLRLAADRLGPQTAR